MPAPGLVGVCPPLTAIFMVAPFRSIPPARPPGSRGCRFRRLQPALSHGPPAFGAHSASHGLARKAPAPPRRACTAPLRHARRVRTQKAGQPPRGLLRGMRRLRGPASLLRDLRDARTLVHLGDAHDGGERAHDGRQDGRGAHERPLHVSHGRRCPDDAEGRLRGRLGGPYGSRPHPLLDVRLHDRSSLAVVLYRQRHDVLVEHRASAVASQLVVRDIGALCILLVLQRAPALRLNEVAMQAHELVAQQRADAVLLGVVGPDERAHLAGYPREEAHRHRAHDRDKNLFHLCLPILPCPACSGRCHNARGRAESHARLRLGPRK
uniref:Uncharacterized protein n=1 Tax=Siphoviridae sp. ctZi05 TaxID=2826385 RepID=A0A8S5N0K8_9CAUD|nr:MAG TPA: hypothetical protein [Siphoviridae sp. ctZi05]